MKKSDSKIILNVSLTSEELEERSSNGEINKDL